MSVKSYSRRIRAQWACFSSSSDSAEILMFRSQLVFTNEQLKIEKCYKSVITFLHYFKIEKAIAIINYSFLVCASFIDCYPCV